MNLQTHVCFGAMVAALFTGRLDFILITAVGSLIPDIDREYWWSPQKFKDEQWHRSLLHNVFVLFELFLVNVQLGIGAFLHTLLDALTTEEDRGVEWLFPLTRLVKRGQEAFVSQKTDDGCGIQLVKQPLAGQRTYFLNEDSIEFTKLSDPDLQEPKPVPWRRTHGPAKNSGIVDTSIFVGFLLVLVYYVASHWGGLGSQWGVVTSGTLNPLWALLAMMVSLYGSGYFRISKPNKSLSLGFLALAVLSFLAALYFGVPAAQNFALPLDPAIMIPAALILALTALAVWKLRTRGGKQAVV